MSPHVLRSSREMAAMSIEVCITKQMIEDFKESAQTGNYKDFKLKYSSIMETFDCKLTYLLISDKYLYLYLVKHFKHCFDYLIKYSSGQRTHEYYGLNDSMNEMFREVENAVKSKDWSKFYTKYRGVADDLINASRDQKQFEVCIEHDCKCYRTFSARDEAIMNSRGHPYISKNSREMITTNSFPNECRGECCQPEPSRQNNKSQYNQSELTLSASNFIEEHNYEAESFGNQLNQCSQQSQSSNTPRSPKRKSSFTVLRISLSDNNSQRQSTVVTNPVNQTQNTASGIRTIPQKSAYSSDNRDSEGNNNQKVNFCLDVTVNSAVPEETPSDADYFKKVVHEPKNDVSSELADEPAVSEAAKSREVPMSKSQIPPQSNTSFGKSFPMGNNKSKVPVEQRAEETVPKNPFIRGSSSLMSFARKQVAGKKLKKEIGTSTIEEELEEGVRTFERDMSIAKRKADEQLGNADEMNNDLTEEYENTKTRPKDLSETMDQESFDEDDEAFQRKLREQNEKFQEELQRQKEERRRRQKEYEENIRKAREESVNRFRLLFACIRQKRLFEEQEEQWAKWIDGCRSNINKLKSDFYSFENDYRNLMKRKEDDLIFFNQDVNLLYGTVTSTFHVLHDDFDKLKQVEQQCPGALFIRVLQKCISGVAVELLDLMSSLEKLLTDHSTFHLIQQKFDSLSANSINQTFKLHSICKTARSEDYTCIEFPELFSSTVIVEVDSDEGEQVTKF